MAHFARKPRLGSRKERVDSKLVEVESVYRSHDDANDVFEHGKDDTKLERDSSSTITKSTRSKVGNYDLTKQATDDDLADYEAYKFDAESGDIEQKEDDGVKIECAATSVSDARVKELLARFLRIHEPKALQDGRFQALLKWTRQRGVPKLRAALMEQFGEDLYALGQAKETFEPIKETSSKKLTIKKSFRSFIILFTRRSSKS